MVKDDNTLNKYNEIQDKVNEKLSIKFYTKPAYDQKHIKVKIGEFDGNNKTNFLGNIIIPEKIYTILALHI